MDHHELTSQHGQQLLKLSKPEACQPILCSMTSLMGLKASSFRSFGRLSFIPEAISLTTPSTDHPFIRQKLIHHSACRSRSPFFSGGRRLAYRSRLSYRGMTDFSGSTRIVPEGVCIVFTGSLPILNQRHAV
jgi:hypothetical protein